MIHITKDDERPVCENEVTADDEMITLEEALAPTGGKYFDCRDCHKVLTGGKRHSEPS